jgi:hypothetical protein
VVDGAGGGSAIRGTEEEEPRGEWLGERRRNSEGAKPSKEALARKKKTGAALSPYDAVVRASPTASTIHFLSPNLAIFHGKRHPTNSPFGIPK